MAETIFETMEDLETLSCVAPQLRQDIGRLKTTRITEQRAQKYTVVCQIRSCDDSPVNICKIHP